MEKRVLENRFHEEEMTEKMEEMGRQERDYVIAGQTDISDEVLSAIAAMAAREIEGVADVGSGTVRRMFMRNVQRQASGASVQAGKKEAIIDLSIKMIYGFSLPQLVIDIRKRVGTRLLEMAGLIAKEINIRVIGIQFPERMPGRYE